MSEDENKEKSPFETRHSLLDRVSDPQDQKSWRVFVDFYDPFIRRVLMRYSLSDADRDDLFQEIIIKLWEQMPETKFDRSRGKFRSWLNVFIRNLVYDRFALNKRRQHLLHENSSHALDQTLGDNGEEAIDTLINEEWEDYIVTVAWEKIEKTLTQVAREVFRLSMEGKKTEEIMEACGIENKLVYMHRKRVKDLMKVEIKELESQF